MNLGEAIEILSDSANKGITTFNQDFGDAEKLAIEALKFRQRWEDQEGEDDFLLLPGETK